MVDPDIVLTVAAVANALDAVGVDWAVGGSVASTIYGEPRATNDVDIVAALQESDVDGLLGALGPSFYADALTVRTAVRTHDSFNLIDERTFLKVDIFVPRSGPMGSGQLDRRRRRNLGDQLSVFVLGPEDTILQQLRWFRLGGEVSERQWRDIVAVLRLSTKLDEAYLHATAKTARLDQLLTRAVSEALGQRPS